MNQRITRNESHYANEFTQRTRGMVDEWGQVAEKFEGQYNTILQEILAKKQQDFYRIQQGQPPSWLSGAGDQEQIQARYNQLRDQGLTPAQIADQLRKEGIQIE